MERTFHENDHRVLTEESAVGNVGSCCADGGGDQSVQSPAGRSSSEANAGPPGYPGTNCNVDEEILGNSGSEADRILSRQSAVESPQEDSASHECLARHGQSEVR